MTASITQRRLTYRVFSSRSGAWRPIQTLGEVERGPGPGVRTRTLYCANTTDVVICRGAVYWLDHHGETTLVTGTCSPWLVDPGVCGVRR